MEETIEKLRQTLPPFLTVKEYCELFNRCEASAFNDLRRTPGLAVKVGGSTRIIRDVMLAEMARLPEWLPQKDRRPTSKKTTRRQHAAALRRERAAGARQ